MAYTIRKLEAEDLHLLPPLMKDCFDMDVDLSYFKWKLLDNPAGLFVGFAAFHNESGVCAGYYGVIPEQYIISGAQTVIFQSGDTMTHSVHRRQGLFVKLASACYHYLEAEKKLFVIGFGGELSTAGLVKLHWQHLFPIRFAGIPKVLCSAYDAIPARSRRKYKYECKKSYELASEIAAKRTEMFQQSYEANFLSWRLSNPRRNYYYEEISYQNTPVGYWCYCLINEKIFVLDCDFSDEKYAKALLYRITSLVKKLKLQGVFSFTQEETRFDVILRRAGFLKNPFSRGPLSQSLPFMVRATDPKAALQPSNWAIRPIYHDAY